MNVSSIKRSLHLWSAAFLRPSRSRSLPPCLLLSRWRGRSWGSAYASWSPTSPTPRTDPNRRPMNITKTFNKHLPYKKVLIKYTWVLYCNAQRCFQCKLLLYKRICCKVGNNWLITDDNDWRWYGVEPSGGGLRARLDCLTKVCDTINMIVLFSPKYQSDGIIMCSH